MNIWKYGGQNPPCQQMELKHVQELENDGYKMGHDPKETLLNTFCRIF